MAKSEPLNREALERLCAQILDEGQADTTAEVQLATAVRSLTNGLDHEAAVAACLDEDDDFESLAATLGFDENYARRVVVPTILNAALRVTDGQE